MAGAGLAKLGIRLSILVQFLIENSDSTCTNSDFNNFSPCEFETLLITSQGPCNVLIPDVSLADKNPTVTLENAEESKNYLLIMVDPDAPDPNNPEMKFWLHWMLHSIKGSSLKKGVVDGSAILEYEPPTPPSGVHRYQFFVFEQPSTFTGSIFIEDRAYFNLQDFASEHNLCHNLKGSYQYYATEQFKLTGAVIMVSGGKVTIPLTSPTVPADSGGDGPDAPAAPKDSATVKPDHKPTKRRKGSGLQSIFPSRVDKIRFLLLLFCATYACKPSC